MKILETCLRIFLIAINSIFSKENEFCLRVKGCILKDFLDLRFLCEAAELKENG